MVPTVPERNPLEFDVYVNAGHSRADLFNAVVAAVHATVDKRRAFRGATPLAAYHLNENDEYDRSKSASSASGAFAYYRYILEINPSPGLAKTTDYFDQVKQVIAAVRALGAIVIPAGIHEDDIME